jgi:hypothetical protein
MEMMEMMERVMIAGLAMPDEKLAHVLKSQGISDPHAFLVSRERNTPVVEHDHPDLQTVGDPHLMAGKLSTDEDLKTKEAGLKIL